MPNSSPDPLQKSMTHPSSAPQSSVKSPYNSQGLNDVAPPLEDVFKLYENKSPLLTLVVVSTVELNTQNGSNVFVKTLSSKTQLKLKWLNTDLLILKKKSHTLCLRMLQRIPGLGAFLGSPGFESVQIIVSVTLETKITGGKLNCLRSELSEIQHMFCNATEFS